MLQFHIRMARPGDEKKIHEAHMRSIREVCVKDHGEEEIIGWGNRTLGDRWVKAIQEGYVWVLEAGEEIFGHAYIQILKNRTPPKAHIMGLYLTPEAIGKNFGHELLTLMLETAQKENVNFITLDATLTAHEFYKRAGFKDTGSLVQHEIGGSRVSCYPMSMKVP